MDRIIVGVFVATLLACPLLANDDAQFIAGLRERRLFDLADTYCNERLSEQSLSDKERADLSVELIRAHTEHALNSQGDKRIELWAKTKEVAERFDNHSEPRVVLVRVQVALADLARGEFERLEAEVSASPSDSLVSARETLRSAASALTAIDRELTEAIPIRRRNPLRPNELSAGELTSLQNHVRYHLARCYKNQALCYAPGSSDRTASLTAATDQLNHSLTQVAPGEELYFDLRLEQMVCHRLLRDTVKVTGLLQSLADSELSSNEQLAIRAEHIRWHVARNSPGDALKLVSEGRKIGDVVSSELDFAWLETYVSMWKAAADANDSKQTEDWRDKSVKMAKFIEQEHGSYWGRRAELLLVRIGAGSGDGSIEILQRTADDLYRKRKFDDAIAAYDKASEVAKNADAAEQEFAFAYKAALIVQQQSKHEAAAERFRTLALRLKGYQHAANAHRLAIENTRKASVATGKWLDEYPKLLREHLENWPSSTSADVVAFWLGEFEAGRRDWSKAVDAFVLVTPSAPHFAKTIEQLGECWSKLLDPLRDDETTLASELERASSILKQVISPQGRVPQMWSPEQREALSVLASLELNFGSDRFHEIEALLKSSLEAESTAADDWQTEATSLLVAIMARQPGRQADAITMLGQVGTASTTQLFALFQQVSSLATGASDSARLDLAKLTIEIAKRLASKRSELDAAQLLTLDRSRAKALAASGDMQTANDVFETLANEYSNNGTVQRDYAEFLLGSNHEPFVKQSLDQWRRISTRTPPRTDNWFQAKYSVALALYKLSDKAGAAKLIRYLQATEDLSKSSLEQEFYKLLQQCNN